MIPDTPVQLPLEAQALLTTATRTETACGAGAMVWHIWGKDRCDSSLAPLVLLHGGSGSWTHWLRSIAPLVASGRRVYIPDLPGFGDSAAPLHGTDADALPEPVAQGLQMLLGDAACDLAGFSFGGMVAGFLAAQFPARVARLLLVGAPGMGIAPDTPFHLRAWRHFKEADKRDAVHRGNLAELMLHHPASISELALRLHVANVLRDRMQGRSLSRTDALACTLLRLQCPLHAIYGREDALFRGQLAALEATLRQAPHFKAFTLIEEAGHWVQFERADAFNAVLLATLNAGLPVSQVARAPITSR
jgi:2-hydroxy-6-oxonona-2,4-dienedioate hydrolase